MEEKLENKFGRFKGRIDAIEEGRARLGYKFVRMISEDKQKFIGWAKQIPHYIEKGVHTEVYYKRDKDDEYLIYAYTMPGRLIT